MTRLERILVATDFSGTSHRAVAYAVSLAVPLQARLIAAHVVPSLAALNYSFPEETHELEKRAYAEARARLPLELPAEYRDRLDFRTVVKTGDVRDELPALIRDEAADLVVMGCNGRRSLERFLLGSAAEAVLRRTPVPVVTVSGRDPERGGGPGRSAAIHRIVYATDFSAGSEAGLRYAADLARILDAELVILHAIGPREIAGWDTAMPEPAGAAAARQRVMARLRQVAEAEAGGDLPVELAVAEGVPHRAIARFAEENNADLLVVNLHNKGVLERAMLGSTAERVIRSARVPVLSIPLPTGPAGEGGPHAEGGRPG
jgi:nucleotide-binding universal stress UspA family protein